MNSELLTEKENQVLNLLAKNYSQKDIAKTLDISYKDCKKITADLICKFESNNKSHCVIKAYCEGFIKK